MSRCIGIALGDVTGVGPEVALKALAQDNRHGEGRFLLIGDEEHARALNQQLGLGLELQVYAGGKTSAQFSLWNPLTEALPPGLPKGAPEAARAAVAWVRAGAELCMRGELDALVTAPVNKEAIVRAGLKFVGQTELLSEMAG